MSTEKRMSEYLLVLREERWTVRRDGKVYGPYPDRESALASAITAAHTSGTNDRSARVLSQGEDGKTEVEWTFGLDPYPTQGAPVGTSSPQGSPERPSGPAAEGWNGLANTALVWSRSWALL